MDPKEITFEMVFRKLKEIVATRGRKGTDKLEQVGALFWHWPCWPRHLTAAGYQDRIGIHWFGFFMSF